MPEMLRQYLRPLAAIAALIGLAAYATIMIRGPQGIRAWQEKRHQIEVLEEENANLQRDINAKKERIEKLKTDPATQELELEKLGLVHKDDTQFRIAGKAPRDEHAKDAAGEAPPRH